MFGREGVKNIKQQSLKKNLKYFFGVTHWATFIFMIFWYVIASIAYIHPVYGTGVRTHDLLIVSRLPKPLVTRPWLLPKVFMFLLRKEIGRERKGGKGREGDRERDIETEGVIDRKGEANKIGNNFLKKTSQSVHDKVCSFMHKKHILYVQNVLA